jgi:hypothetical protein
MATVSASARQLRVALVFGGTIEAEELLRRPRPVVLGYGNDALLPLPTSLVEGDRLQLFQPSGAGYTLSLHPDMGGSLWLDGHRREAHEVRSLGPALPLGPDDFGVLTLGTIAIFFQMVKPGPGKVGAGFPSFLYPAPLLALLLSFFLHAAVFVLFLLAMRLMPEREPLELAPDLVRRFMVTPPPELVEQEAAAQMEDLGLRDQEEAGGEAAAEEEGRVGREDAEQEQTEMEGEVTGGGAAQRVANLGLLGALRGGEGEQSALNAALEGPSIDDLLGGLGSSRTVMGRGSGGLGLRGTGQGGGGTGPGTIFGTGQLGTGVGAGRGAGGGRGQGGPGGGGGRPREEVRVQMTTATPRVSGYLSPEQIMRVVRRNQAAVRYCYENELQRQPSLHGRIEIRWRITRSGTVSSASVGSTTMRNGRVEGCIVRQVRNWRFDQPDGGEVDVNFPFIFGSGA